MLGGTRLGPSSRGWFKRGRSSSLGRRWRRRRRAAAAEGEKGGGWERVVVFPLGVQSRPAAVVLCIFQTQLNGPGWVVPRRGEGSEAARAGAEYILFHTEASLCSGNVAGRGRNCCRLDCCYQGAAEIFRRL